MTQRQFHRVFTPTHRGETVALHGFVASTLIVPPPSGPKVAIDSAMSRRLTLKARPLAQCRAPGDNAARQGSGPIVLAVAKSEGATS